MLFHQLKTAWRNLIRQKGYTLINVLGLSVGIGASLVIYLVTSYELSYDRFHPDTDRIYRLVAIQRDEQHKGDGLGFMIRPLPLALRNELTGFDQVTEFHHYYGRVSVPEQEGEPRQFDAAKWGEELSPIIIAEPNYFDVFKYKWLSGNPATALKEPFTVVLTEKEAHKYFGMLSLDQIVGKDLYYGDIWREDSLHVTVTGIVRDWDDNTDLAFSDFLSFSTIDHSWLKQEIDLGHWGNWSPQCQSFIRLAKGVTPQQVERQFPAFIAAHVPPYPGHTTELRLQPLTDLHFNSEYHDQYPRKAHLPTLYALIGIAAFILIIAAINFINLSTARSIHRAKEIGVRKVLGSGRTGLRIQFLIETGLVTASAVLISIPLSYLALSVFHSSIPPGVRLKLAEPAIWIFLIALTIATTLLAGFYPARVLSAYQPALSLKGQGAIQFNRKSSLRKVLIVFQFMISLIFIICAAVIGDQVHYILSKDLGFQKDAIITLRPAWHDPTEKLDLFAGQVRQITAVSGITTHMETPAAKTHSSTWLMCRDAPEVKPAAFYETCDENYVPLFGLTLLAGRNLSHSDTVRDFLINETLMKALGFRRPEDAIGKAVEDGNDSQGFIVGVVRDFNAVSLHEKIMPFYMKTNKAWEKAISIKLATQDRSTAEFSSTLARMEKIWKSIYPDERFDYSFFDQTIERLYRSEQNTARLMNAAMFIAIFISCMGLFGLATFTAGQRIKEIAIRKTLGAGVGNILALLNRELIRLVGIAVLIASPIAWYGMHLWLRDFAYRISISGWLFAAAALAALALAFLTTSYQTIKAARANPIDGLRSE